jgi:hypothetical protein
MTYIVCGVGTVIRSEMRCIAILLGLLRIRIAIGRQESGMPVGTELGTAIALRTFESPGGGPLDARVWGKGPDSSLLAFSAILLPPFHPFSRILLNLAPSQNKLIE